MLKLSNWHAKRKWINNHLIVPNMPKGLCTVYLWCYKRFLFEINSFEFSIHQRILYEKKCIMVFYKNVKQHYLENNKMHQIWIFKWFTDMSQMFVSQTTLNNCTDCLFLCVSYMVNSIARDAFGRYFVDCMSFTYSWHHFIQIKHGICSQRTFGTTAVMCY